MAEARVISRLLIMGFISLIINSVVVFPIAALNCINVSSIVNRFNTPYTIASAIFYSILFLFNIVYMVLNVVSSSLSSLYENRFRKVGVVFLIVINSILAFFVINLIFLIIAFVTPSSYIYTLYGNAGRIGIAIGVCQCYLFVYGIIHIVVICKNRDTTAGGDSTVISHLFVLGIVSKIVNFILLVTIATISCFFGIIFAPGFIYRSSFVASIPAAFYWLQFLFSIAFLVTHVIVFTLGYLHKVLLRKVAATFLIVTCLILSLFFLLNLILAIVVGFVVGFYVAIVAFLAVVCHIVLFVYNMIHAQVVWKSFKLGDIRTRELQ